ncbi:hypothetical protein O6R05_06880 [Peptoniphilus equinus]|uniref:Uncharacterized protein n=1 Tax=Peptoniphilus equinus TaxID=3016343 RepID=A0ABY7QUL5_9FIRM|nr:hypothetical protein [Peptoniphilus equinus]WBW49720.1 hypothetical protein O6R05_06880 [Peptoniphilus equinus]
MNRKLKDLILLGIFIVILFISTISNQFSTDILWKQDNSVREYQGLLFNAPADITGLKVSRGNTQEGLVTYNVEFSYIGSGSGLRILGTPVRQVFFDEGLTPKHSEVKLRGDYSKINDLLVNEKLTVKPHGDNVPPFEARSTMRVDLDPEVEHYAFTLHYAPLETNYRMTDKVADTSVFITNAKVDKFTNSQTNTDAKTTTFSESGFTVNVEENQNSSTMSHVTFLDTVSKVVFIGAALGVVALIYLTRREHHALVIVLMMLMVLSFYRMLDMGATTIGTLVVMPIVFYIGTVLARFMGKERLHVNGKELKQNLAFTVVFFVAALVLIVLPQAF